MYYYMVVWQLFLGRLRDDAAKLGVAAGLSSVGALFPSDITFWFTTSVSKSVNARHLSYLSRLKKPP